MILRELVGKIAVDTMKARMQIQGFDDRLDTSKKGMDGYQRVGRRVTGRIGRGFSLLKKNTARAAVATVAGFKSMKTAASQFAKTLEKNYQEASDSGAGFVATLGKQRGKVIALAGAMGAIIFPGKAAAEFEKKMAEVNTILEASPEKLNKIEKELLKQSAIYGKLPTEQAEGFYQILSAGVTDVDAALKVLAESTKLGIAGVASTGAAAEATTRIMNAFGGGVEGVTNITDDLFTVVKKGVTTLPQFANEIGRAASAAKQAGLTQEEFLTLFAETTRDLSSSESVTAVASFANTFIKATDSMKDKAREFGIELTPTALRTEGLVSVLEKVAVAVEKDEAAIGQIFPNIKALSAVLSAVRGGGEGFNSTLQAMGDNAGAAQKAFDKMASTTTSKFAEFGQTFSSEILIPLGKPLLGVANGLLDVGKSVIGLLGSFIDATGPLGANILGFTAGILGLNTGFALGKAVLGPFFKTLKDFKEAFGAPLRFVKGLKKSIVDSIPTIKKWGGKIIDLAKGQLPNLSSKLWTATTRVWAYTTSMITGAVRSTGRFLASIGRMALALGSSLVPMLGRATAAAWAFIAPLLANPITWIVAGIVALGAALVALVLNWDKVVDFAKKAWRTIARAWSGAGDFFSDIAGNIGRFFGGLWDGMLNGAKSVLDNIVGFFQNAFEGIKTWIGENFNLPKILGDMVSGGVNFLLNPIGAMLQGVDNLLPHSPAKEGPLSKLDEVGPGFVDTISKGIVGREGVLLGSVRKSLAKALTALEESPELRIQAKAEIQGMEDSLLLRQVTDQAPDKNKSPKQVTETSDRKLFIKEDRGESVNSERLKDAIAKLGSLGLKLSKIKLNLDPAILKNIKVVESGTPAVTPMPFKTPSRVMESFDNRQEFHSESSKDVEINFHIHNKFEGEVTPEVARSSAQNLLAEIKKIKDQIAEELADPMIPFVRGEMLLMNQRLRNHPATEHEQPGFGQPLNKRATT